MGTNSKIEWTDATWNPTTGCSKVSDGCKNCYAERVTARFRKDHLPWTLQNAAHNVVLHPERLDIPMRWKKPRRVFVDSMSDLFHEQVPEEFIHQVFTVMRNCPQHTFQVLTKRADRMFDVLNHLSWYAHTSKYGWQAYRGTPGSYIAPNVWLGVSVEDQKAADERIPLLLKTPAAKRFLSCEPLLGEVDLNPYFYNAGGMIGWVIAGGESGAKARPMNPEWARGLRDACAAWSVPFFFKQWGEHDDEGKRVGKGKAGRLLDGVEWNEVPA